MSSERIDHARRLELSEVRDVGDFVTGRARGLAVSLEGAHPFSACVVELGVTIPIWRMRMQAGDLNHPDAVETGDVDFDERMVVTAQPTYAPTLEQILSPAPLRAGLLKFFAKYPDAEFVGTKLRVPAGAEGVTQRLIGDALEVCDVIVRRFGEIGVLSSEAPATLPPGSRDVLPWRSIATRAAFGGIVWSGFAYAIGLPMGPAFLFGLMVVGLFGTSALEAPKK